METKKVFALLSLDRTINYSVGCGNCKANVFVNPFAFPFNVNITSEQSSVELIKKLEKVTERAFQLKGEWSMDDFIKAVQIPTLNFQTTPESINQDSQVKVDPPAESALSKEKQIDSFVAYLRDNGYDVELKKSNPLE